MFTLVSEYLITLIFECGTWRAVLWDFTSWLAQNVLLYCVWWTVCIWWSQDVSLLIVPTCINRWFSVFCSENTVLLPYYIKWQNFLVEYSYSKLVWIVTYIYTTWSFLSIWFGAASCLSNINTLWLYCVSVVSGC